MSTEHGGIDVDRQLRAFAVALEAHTGEPIRPGRRPVDDDGRERGMHDRVQRHVDPTTQSQDTPALHLFIEPSRDTNDPTMEVVMPSPDRNESPTTTHRWMMVAAAVATLVVVVGLLVVATRADEAPAPADQPELTVPPEPPSVSEGLYGVWLTPDNANHLSFNEDDTWSFSHAEDPVDSFRNRGFGPFTFDGELLSLFTDPASRNCSRNSGVFDAEITGTYEAVITPEGNLELTDVDDLCINRKIEFRGSLSDPDALHQTGILQPYSP